MTQERLNQLIEEGRKRRIQLEAQKGKEYTQGNPDRLANFKRMGAELLSVLPDGARLEQAAMLSWLISFNKHYDGVKSFIRHGREFSSEGVESRIDDMQVYLDLLRGLVCEMKEVQEPKQ